MTTFLPLFAALLTIGALTTPVLAQDSDQEDEVQMDEEVAEESSEEEAPGDEEVEEETSDESESVADEPEAEAAEEESEPAESAAADEPAASSPEPDSRSRGIADGTWSGGMHTAMGYRALQFTIENSNASVVTGDFGQNSTQLSVSGNEVTWSWSVTVPMPMEIQCSGQITGDTLNGNCKLGPFGVSAVQLKRN